MPFARYSWEEPGAREMMARGPAPVPADMASQPMGWVHEGHGVVLSGTEEYQAAKDAMDAWYSSHAGRVLTEAETEDLYGMCLSGEPSLFRPLAWYMAHWRARYRP